MEIAKGLAYIDKLYDMFVPADVPITCGAFLSGDVDCLSILDEIAAIEMMTPEAASKSTPHDGVYGLMLDFADTLIRDDVAFMPYGAIVAAYVSLRVPPDIYGARIERLLGQIDDRFEQVREKAQTTQALEMCMRSEFEAYYCAARILPFEGSFISRKIHGRLNQLLVDCHFLRF